MEGVLTENLSFLMPFVLGHLYYHSNNYEAGHQAFDVAMQNIPTNVAIENEAILHFFRAREMSRNAGNIDAIVCEYTQAILKDPGFDVAYNNLGLVISGLYGNLPPISAEPFVPMKPEALACLQQLQQTGAIGAEVQDPKKYFERALEINGSLTLAKFNLYAFEWMQNRDQAALPPILSEIEQIQHDDASIIGTYIILGIAKERQGDVAGAIQMYQSGINQMDSLARINTADSKIALMRFNAGQLLDLQGDWSAAELQFKQILESDPEHDKALLALGNLYYRQGAFNEADAVLDTHLAMLVKMGDPDLHFRQSSAAMLHSSADFQLGDLPSAIAYLNRAIQMTSHGPFPYLLLGLLYQYDGRNDLAVENFDKAAALNLPLKQKVWSSFEDQCLNNPEAQSLPFSDWVLNRLPSSSCLGSDLNDPQARVLAFYGLLSTDLIQYRELPSFSLTAAQCPYVFTKDPVSGAWEFQTTILYQLVNHEAAQLRPLTQFNGQLLIQEVEPEISHINRLYVLAKMAAGSFRILEPNIEKLKHVDGEYIVLHQGEQLVVSLDNYPITGDVSQWWVMAVGYYIPIP